MEERDVSFQAICTLFAVSMRNGLKKHLHDGQGIIMDIVKDRWCPRRAHVADVAASEHRGLVKRALRGNS
jgi:hypothetical protein